MWMSGKSVQIVDFPTTTLEPPTREGNACCGDDVDAAGVVEDEVHRRWMDDFSAMSDPPTYVRVRSR